MPPERLHLLRHLRSSLNRLRSPNPKSRRQGKRLPITPCWHRPLLEQLEDRVAPATLGVDVSHYQGSIDWSQVAAADGAQSFAIIKAAQGTTIADAYFTSNATNAASSGLVVGAYDYANPDADPLLKSNPANTAELLTDADAEANFFVQTAGSWISPGHLQPVLDLEADNGGGGFNSDFTAAQIGAWTTEWIAQLQRDVPGLTPILYMNQSYAVVLSSATPSLTEYPLWIAALNNNQAFAPNTGAWPSWSIMQWTSTGSVAGITTDVDQDVLNSGTTPGALEITQLQLTTATQVDPAHIGLNYTVADPSVALPVTLNVYRTATGAQPAPAQASATVENGAVTSVTLSSAGAAYTSAPSVSFVGGGGSGAQAHAVIANGVVTTIVIDDAGSGYTSAPTVVIDDPSAIGTVTIPVSDLGQGLHTNVSLPLLDSHGNPVALNIDPHNEFIDLVYDDGSQPAGHEVAFQKLVLGVVTQGFELNGAQPPDFATLAQALRADNYDDVILFNWASVSNIPASGYITLEAETLAYQVQNAADQLLAGVGPNGPLPKPPEGSVVDLHFIGHSRGAGVVTYAMLDLQSAAALDPALVGSYKVLTLLDPHPANGQSPSSYGNVNNIASAGVLGAGEAAAGAFALAGNTVFAAAAADPNIVIPTNVNEVQEIYQQTASSDFTSRSDTTGMLQTVMNLQGISPSQIQFSPSTTTISAGVPVPGTILFENLLLPGFGHSDIVPWYFSEGPAHTANPSIWNTSAWTETQPGTGESPPDQNEQLLQYLAYPSGGATQADVSTVDQASSNLSMAASASPQDPPGIDSPQASDLANGLNELSSLTDLSAAGVANLADINVLLDQVLNEDDLTANGGTGSALVTSAAQGSSDGNITAQDQTLGSSISATLTLPAGLTVSTGQAEQADVSVDAFADDPTGTQSAGNVAVGSTELTPQAYFDAQITGVTAGQGASMTITLVAPDPGGASLQLISFNGSAWQIDNGATVALNSPAQGEATITATFNDNSTPAVGDMTSDLGGISFAVATPVSTVSGTALSMLKSRLCSKASPAWCSGHSRISRISKQSNRRFRSSRSAITWLMPFSVDSSTRSFSTWRNPTRRSRAWSSYWRI